MIDKEIISKIEQTKEKICEIQELATSEFIIPKATHSSIMHSIIFSFDGILEELKKLNEALSESQSVSDNEKAKEICSNCEYYKYSNLAYPCNCCTKDNSMFEQID